MNNLSTTIALNPDQVWGPTMVTLVYLLLYYAFMVNILFVKIRLVKRYKERGEKFDRYFSQDPEMLAADRIQLNMLEHMAPFLILMWLHALLVSSFEATVLGGIYTLSRLLYPFLVKNGIKRQIPMRILFSTVIGYLIIFIMTIRVFFKII